MIPYERKERILEYLSHHPSATVRELAGELFISEASVRRDLSALEQEGLIVRHYGGVMLSGNRNGVVPVSLRDGENSSVKEDIARRAAALIRDGDVVMMDASSTVRRMLRYLNDRRDVTIITNNLQIFSECRNPSIRLYSTGGMYSSENHALIGAEAERALLDFSADAVFFSSQGISEDGEITDASEAETALRRVMLARSRRRYFLCDSSKIGVRRLFSLCHKDDLTDVIGDCPFPWEG